MWARRAHVGGIRSSLSTSIHRQREFLPSSCLWVALQYSWQTILLSHRYMHWLRRIEKLAHGSIIVPRLLGWTFRCDVLRTLPAVAQCQSQRQSMSQRMTSIRHTAAWNDVASGPLVARVELGVGCRVVRRDSPGPCVQFSRPSRLRIAAALRRRRKTTQACPQANEGLSLSRLACVSYTAILQLYSVLAPHAPV